MPASNIPDIRVLSGILRSIAFGAPPIALWLNGIFACLVACTIWITANKEESKVRKIAWISILFALYIAAALHATLPLAWELSVIVNHATSFADEVGALGHPPHWYLALTSPMELFTVFVGDCISIWRCWVVWGRRWVFIVTPCLCLIASNSTVCSSKLPRESTNVCLVLGILTIVGEFNKTVGPGLIARLARSSSVPYCALVLATTVYCTILIIIRILLVQFAFDEGPNRRRFSAYYSRATEIIVESCIIYSSVLVATVVLSDLKSPGIAWPIALLPQIAGIFPTLMLLRVMAGSARPDPQWISTINIRVSDVAGSTMMDSVPMSFAPSAGSATNSGLPQHATKTSSAEPLPFDPVTTTHRGGSDVESLPWV